MNYPIISILVIFLVVLGLIVIIFRLRKEEEDIAPEQQATLSDSESEEDKTKQKKNMLISVGIALALMAGAIAYMFFKKSGSNGSEDNSSFVAFIPIWAAFIPLFSKKKKMNSIKHKKLLAILIALVVLGLAVMILFGFLINK